MVSSSHASTRGLPPPPSLPFPVKEHMVQINSCQQRRQREEGKRGRRAREQTREEEISGIAVRSEECLHFVPWKPAASHSP